MQQLERGRLRATQGRRSFGRGGNLALQVRDPALEVGLARQRLGNLESCEVTLKQVDSDLARIEAQVDLALEWRARPPAAEERSAADLELASQTLEDGLDFGEAEATVTALDAAYGEPSRVPKSGA